MMTCRKSVSFIVNAFSQAARHAVAYFRNGTLNPICISCLKRLILNESLFFFNEDAHSRKIHLSQYIEWKRRDFAWQFSPKIGARALGVSIYFKKNSGNTLIFIA